MFIPKNSTVFANLAGIVHNATIFPDPENFCPKRLLTRDFKPFTYVGKKNLCVCIDLYQHPSRHEPISIPSLSMFPVSSGRLMSPLLLTSSKRKIYQTPGIIPTDSIPIRSASIA
ncbi:uncharacterized protein BJ212DRAFT_1345369 [Suillus subaureus]|uniref:Uncharacterized protein n=1 Tax=Suillus subaureus TaxID=48587 RepID=A0A9P7JFH0_9AGAM|nr:uncharacterized protein BJ212DRAFT_1345369 [Suillus subaureus]KAG1819303.1 hypothetical protein BJ212DRAFT_1345369 [Suillus subaureus]